MPNQFGSVEWLFNQRFLYYGLGGCKRYTLPDIASKLSLSRAEVISLRDRALASLRGSLERQQLDASCVLQD